MAMPLFAILPLTAAPLHERQMSKVMREEEEEEEGEGEGSFEF